MQPSQEPVNHAKKEWEVFTFVVPVNSEEQYNRNFAASPDLSSASGYQVIKQQGWTSASRAYNAGMVKAANDVVVFCHQDVYLPAGWTERLKSLLHDLDRRLVRWGVLGVYGVGVDGEQVGHVYCNAMGRVLGQPLEPTEAVSLDELLLVIRKSSGLRFDSELPGFHLYGTDICLAAHNSNLSCLIADLYCVHNTRKVWPLPREYWRAAKYLRRKWKPHLPVRSTCGIVYASALPEVVRRGRLWLASRISPATLRERVSDPTCLPVRYPAGRDG